MRNLSFSMWQSRWRKQDTTILLSPFVLPRADITTIGPADQSSHKISWTKGRTRPKTETSFDKTRLWHLQVVVFVRRILWQIFWTKIRPCPINYSRSAKAVDLQAVRFLVIFSLESNCSPGNSPGITYGLVTLWPLVCPRSEMHFVGENDFQALVEPLGHLK